LAARGRAPWRERCPAGPKYLYASPQFWPPFHAEPGTTFYSYAAAWPVNGESSTTIAGVSSNRPIFLLVDELQWLPELTGPGSSTTEWQKGWIDFIERRCALDGVALGTAHGTLALYRCALAGPAPAPVEKAPRLVGADTEYGVGECVMAQSAADLARWPRYDDPRRTPAARPEVLLTDAGLRVRGSGWPGIVRMVDAIPGDRYLVRTTTQQTRDGDLLYLGRWEEPQVRSLSGASS